MAASLKNSWAAGAEAMAKLVKLVKLVKTGLDMMRTYSENVGRVFKERSSKALWTVLARASESRLKSKLC